MTTDEPGTSRPQMIDAMPASDWIGRSRTTTAQLSAHHANLLAVTLDREPNLADGDELPPAWHWLYFPDIVRSADLGPDGHPGPGVTMPPVIDLPRRMWAAGSLQWLRPLRLGESAERTTTIRDVRRTDGRSGELCFVTVDHVVRVDGETALNETQDVVYREVATGSVPVDGPAAPDGADFSDRWHLGKVDLFRYSALTFNSHRIHYDADYCRAVEGYPDVVVHGPLLATLLMDALARRGDRLESITYRARSPLFLPDPFVVNGRRDADGATVWAATQEGRLAMEAHVQLRTGNP